MVPLYFRHIEEDQSVFAELSGDFNPVHIDPVHARRTIFGQVVSHGVHNALRALELYLETLKGVTHVERIAATFKNPLFLEERAAVDFQQVKESLVLLTLKCGTVEILDIRLNLKMGPLQQKPIHLTPPIFNQAPLKRSFSQLVKEEGDIELKGDKDHIENLFPCCVRSLGVDGVARLLCLTRLVGMQCPGLHSLFSGFDVSFSAVRTNEPTHYRVIQADERISRISMSVDGGGMTGNVSAFMRPAPVLQPDMETVGKLITGYPFRGIQALIIGGSRGLGEISAKIIAAGGGDVAITYLTGEDDASRVSKEISRQGGSCRTLHLDVSEPSQSIISLCRENWLPTHLLYFATPRISARKSETAKDQFTEVYSRGVEKVVDVLFERFSGPLTLFYPSSIYVTEAPSDLADYATAKAEGERTVSKLAEGQENLRVTIERLPPLATDQTASLLNVAVRDPLETMVGVLGKTLC